MASRYESGLNSRKITAKNYEVKMLKRVQMNSNQHARSKYAEKDDFQSWKQKIAQGHYNSQ